MRTLALLSILLFLTGCSTAGDYYKSVDASNAHNVSLAKAHAEAEAVRYQALMRIAESGDATAKVAATMALALGAGTRQAQAAVAQPQRSEALEWASILVPGVTQGLSIYYNSKQAINANNNATRLGINTNQTFGQFASEINDPTIVTQPAPTIVTQPAPTVVRPEVVRPDIVVQPDPTIVDPRDPVIVEPRDPVIVTQPPPTVITQPAPVIVNPPPAQVVNPIVVNPPPAQVVDPVIVQPPVTQEP